MDLHNLEYWIGERHVETPVQAKPKAICKWKKDILKTTTHKLGKLKIKKCTS